MIKAVSQNEKGQLLPALYICATLLSCENADVNEEIPQTVNTGCPTVVSFANTLWFSSTVLIVRAGVK